MKNTVLLLVLLAPACTSSESKPVAARSVAVTVAPPSPEAEKPVDLQGVHNVVAYTADLFSGSVPEGEAGFETLAAMGVRTIVSVDGAAPDVEAARALGLGYVHLPIGYDGMTPERTLEIAKAIEVGPGRVYVHCHHGKHRSAGAAAAAAVTLGRLSNEQAVLRMKVSGTAANYTGLFEGATTAKPASAALLSAVPARFPERVVPAGIKKSMIAIDEANDELKAIEKAGWKVPADHPDLVPAEVAKRMIDHLETLSAEAETRERPAEFGEWLRADVEKLGALRAGLADGGVAAEELGARMQPVQQSCKQCHAKYRD